MVRVIALQNKSVHQTSFSKQGTKLGNTVVPFLTSYSSLLANQLVISLRVYIAAATSAKVYHVHLSHLH